MTTQEAYDLGKRHGHGFACHNVPRLGDKLWLEDMGCVTVDAENIREVHQSSCFVAESNSRSYSPWEFTAHAINESEDFEALWEEYERGVADAIFADLATYTDEDYGL
jgi:hypothetical protein